MNDSAVETKEAVKAAIQASIRDARVTVAGSRGHFEIDVQAKDFEGKSDLERQRMVYRTIAPLMAGENAPIHAVDKLTTSATQPPEPRTTSTTGSTTTDEHTNQRPFTLVTITREAQAEVKRLAGAQANSNHGLRLCIKGGGCSGLTYGLEFTEQRPGDTVVEYDGFRVFLDKKSTIYLGGVTLDYQGGLSGRGFVFNNPHAASTCGCGESFSL